MEGFAALFRRGVGRLLTASALFLLVFWGSQALARIFWVIGHPRLVAEGPPGILTGALLKLVLTAILSAVLFAMGRRLAEPGRHDRLVCDLAGEIVNSAGERGEEPVITDEVSSLYGNLPLAELVLIHSALDRRKHPSRYRALLDAIRQRVAEDKICLIIPRDGS